MGRADRAAVIFDLDGVLIDSRSAISGCINHALAARGLPVRRGADLYRYIGPPLAVAFADLLGEDVQSEAVTACVATYRARYAQASLQQTAAVPGIAAVLAELGGTIGLPSPHQSRWRSLGRCLICSNSVADSTSSQAQICALAAPTRQRRSQQH